MVTILIAARNEEDSILACIQSCLNQNYPPNKLEVIVVDDQSEDDTYDLLESIEDPRFVHMRLGVYKRTTIKGSKKKAIAYGVNHAKGELIFTTDADCLVAPDWIQSMIPFFNDPKVKLVSGPVKITNRSSLIARFQALDFSANGLVNAAGIKSGLHYLCSGANLAYRKQVFLEHNVYEDNYHIASGDDIFLLEKIKSVYPDGIVFSKLANSIVETQAVSNWTDLIKQRLRWAGKMRHITDWNLKWIPALIWIQRILLLSFLVVAISLGSVNYILASITAIMLQLLLDFLLQYDACRFYKISKWQIWFIVLEPLHTIYFILLGIASWLPVSIEWKGRSNP
jgi:cellulose synthase/poly-beta-1,6-N-acetylglucosamine synthase-like glycosyltransferase